MKVELLNPTEIKMLFWNWGTVAKVCYATETDSPERIGKGCMASGHASGSRGEFFKFYVTDCPRFTVDQAIRSEQGVFKNVGSFRYIDEGIFAYEIPDLITDNSELVDKYIKHMDRTMELYQEIQSYVKDKTDENEVANQSARYVLPMATHTSFVIGFTIEALIHFCNMRLCTRAEDKIQELARQMKDEALKVLPELKDKLVPQCQALLYCPEHKSCGAYPKKKELKELIEIGKQAKKEQMNKE